MLRSFTAVLFLAATFHIYLCALHEHFVVAFQASLRAWRHWRHSRPSFPFLSIAMSTSRRDREAQVAPVPGNYAASPRAHRNQAAVSRAPCCWTIRSIGARLVQLWLPPSFFTLSGGLSSRCDIAGKKAVALLNLRVRTFSTRKQYGRRSDSASCFAALCFSYPFDTVSITFISLVSIPSKTRATRMIPSRASGGQ